MSTPNRASNPAGKPRRKEITLDLRTARQMLPLVRSIVIDIIGTRQTLNQLTPEQQRLDRHRRDLAWLERERRYQILDERTAAEKKLAAALSELNELGLNYFDGESGEVDFPTKINGKPAAYTWKFGDEGLRFWHYTGEEQRRPIPSDWDQATSTSGSTSGRFRGQP